ncbi:hypothetical protein NDU88_001097 [Pleurodeles waltl]|uniref:Uncharacterized protein n=1 Tax=Pleurodeles waltl TaxID=8319 RepID=A0AAV7URW4_PLEWA|nr:hypothetical protein NDU88_001097 [Pleurodeles waltl]
MSGPVAPGKEGGPQRVMPLRLRVMHMVRSGTRNKDNYRADFPFFPFKVALSCAVRRSWQRVAGASRPFSF